MGPVIVIVVLVALAWVAFALPARRRQRSHAAMQDGVVVGDEIITAGGIHGVVREASDEELRIEIAAGVVVTLDRRAVAAVAVEEEPEEPDEPDEPESGLKDSGPEPAGSGREPEQPSQIARGPG
jgi:preprotein translocase subunit YajC